MFSSRWIFIPALVLLFSGCAEETVPAGATNSAAQAPTNLDAGTVTKLDTKTIKDMAGPDPNKFQTGPDPRKPVAGKEAATSNADTRPDPAPSDAERKAVTGKADADKKPASEKSDADKKAADAPLSPDELLKKAQAAVERDDVKTALSLLEKVLVAEPKNHEALLNLALLNHREAAQLERPKSSPYFLKAAEWMRKLRDASGKLDDNEKQAMGLFLYNEACTHAVQGEAAKAIKSLEEANELGNIPLDEVKKNEELASIRKLPAYDALLKRIEEKAAAAARLEAEAARAHAKVTLAKNKPFKFGFELPELDGKKKISLAGFKGKVVIVDVWGTWCPPCRAEIPHFVELYKKFHDKGLEIVGLNYENEADDVAKKTIKEFIDKYKMPYPCVLGTEEVQKQIPDFEGFPTTLFIDRTGKVRAKTVGFDESMTEELNAIVTTLLDEQPAKP